MLNNIRNKFDPLLERVGTGFASLGFGPKFWTWLGLIFSIISAIMFSLHSPAIGVEWYTATFLGALFLIIAGFFDAIDGAVARVTGKTSTLGGYVDSVIDKVSEIIVFVGILVGNFTNPVLVIVALSLSLLVSYTRARGETAGVDLKGKGIAERAERILIISILGFIPFQANISVALWIIAILAIITVVERVKIVCSKYGVSLFSTQTYADIFKRDTEKTYDSLSSSSKFNTEPTTSITKVTKNVDDFLDRTESKSSSSSSSNTDTSYKKDEAKPREIDNKKPPSSSANFLDKTDPNETGRNVAQILFDQENEDRIYKSKNTNTNANTNTNTSKNTNTNTNANTNTNTSKNTNTNTNANISSSVSEPKDRIKKDQTNTNDTKNSDI